MAVDTLCEVFITKANLAKKRNPYNIPIISSLGNPNTLRNNSLEIISVRNVVSWYVL